MKIGALIPTRGDRPKLLNHAIEQMQNQTTKPDVIEIMNDTPINFDKDITWRYRIGCERILSKGVDIVFLIEDDDYYDCSYIETVFSAWNLAGRSEIFGIGETTYYHLGLRAWYHQSHKERASAFCTMITREGINKMKWPKDNYSFTDIEFWKQLKGKTFISERPIALGIKGHNEGSLFGGIGHNKQWGGYKNFDLDLSWLKHTINKEAFEFYKKIS